MTIQLGNNDAIPRGDIAALYHPRRWRSRRWRSWYSIQRVGGIWFWRIGRLGGSLYWSTTRQDPETRSVEKALRAQRRQAERQHHRQLIRLCSTCYHYDTEDR
jgi:hypothetical protein